MLEPVVKLMAGSAPIVDVDVDLDLDLELGVGVGVFVDSVDAGKPKPLSRAPARKPKSSGMMRMESLANCTSKAASSRPPHMSRAPRMGKRLSVSHMMSREGVQTLWRKSEVGNSFVMSWK